jgi:hypothetical protein
VGQAWQQADEPLREHRLAGARRADQEDVMPARRRDLQRVPGVVLPDDVGEIGWLGSGAVGDRTGRAQAATALQEGQYLGQALRTVHVDALDHGGLRQRRVG